MTDYLANPHQLFDIKGKAAIVTGASGAFGAVAAKTLAGAGARLVLAAGNAAELEETAATCRGYGAEVKAVALRHNSEAEADAIVQAAVDAYGRVDILVIGAGLNDVSPIVDMAPERFLRVMDGNVTGSWLICKAFGKRAIAQGEGGKVVLMSSARGKLGHPAGYSAYCASKAAVEGITKALGCEWGRYRITVNAIAPTVFRSKLTAWMYAGDEKGTTVRNGMLARIPIGRLGEPEDLAGPLLFLCSKASDFYTGHTLDADGGYTAG